MPKTKGKKARFKVGDRAAYRLSTRDWIVTILADGGVLGPYGRRYYVRRVGEMSDPLFNEVREADLDPLMQPSHEQVVAYLCKGGLFAILRAYTYPWPEPDTGRLWLNMTPRNGISFTSMAENGMIGGAVVPIGVLTKQGIPEDRRREVLDFLASFGLSEEEGQAAIDAVNQRQP